ncbi:hypothetical protein GGS26DRAFT_167147 [Hypomontagnella submonticulosa]|nr:hypothetical protein GGS26DRAFT_167147 [Hypomontagnella submonticulosa]
MTPLPHLSLMIRSDVLAWPSHDDALAARVVFARAEAPAVAALDVHDHADLVLVVATRHGASGTQASIVDDGRGLARDAVSEFAASVESFSWKARLEDLEPVVLAAAAAEVCSMCGRHDGQRLVPEKASVVRNESRN